MAQRKQYAKKGMMRPVRQPIPPEEFSSNSSSDEEEQQPPRRRYTSYTQRADEQLSRKKLANKRLKRQLLTRKMDHLIKMCDDFEPLADSILDLSHETDHYNVPIRAFQGEWNSITTMQYALESLQQWIAFGEEVQHIGTVSDDIKPGQQQQPSEVQKKFFDLSSSTEEESNN
ncbi:hypothetical protein M9Y10_029078 [Tritrichomonas musculus]|uniref:BZIP domain-containing protein n=1 Tax=Tritrichomonas musculus TaxID=1915356 RepID=A0ABR2KM02_9EUKA